MGKPSKSELHKALKELVENLSGGVVEGFEYALSKSNYLCLIRDKNEMLSSPGRGVAVPEKLVRKSLSLSGIEVPNPIKVLVLSPVLMSDISLPESMYDFTYDVGGSFVEVGISFFGRMPDVFHTPGKYIEVDDQGNYGCIRSIINAYDRYTSSKYSIDFDKLVDGKREGSYYKIKMMDTHCGNGEELCVLKMQFMRSPDNLPAINYIKYGEYSEMDKCLERIVEYIGRFDPVECIYLLPGSSRGLKVFEDDKGGHHLIVYDNI